MRVALGAGRGRIVRQLLTESIVLRLAGTLLGLAVAYVGVRLLLGIGAAKLPRLDAVPFDRNVLLFALVTLVVSGVARRVRAGAPARAHRREDADEREQPPPAGGPRHRALAQRDDRRQIALAITLVASAGWLIRGFANLRDTDPGFVADKRLLFDVAFRAELPR